MQLLHYFLLSDCINILFSLMHVKEIFLCQGKLNLILSINLFSYYKVLSKVCMHHLVNLNGDLLIWVILFGLKLFVNIRNSLYEHKALRTFSNKWNWFNSTSNEPHQTGWKQYLINYMKNLKFKCSYC